MKKELAKTLLALPHNENRRLPSIRAIMTTYHVSSYTVQKALSILSQLKKIKRIRGKGCFWTSPNSNENEQLFSTKLKPSIRETSQEKLERLFKNDWEKGFLKSDNPLPLMKQLAERYNVSQIVLRNFLMTKIENKILTRSGRNFYFVQKNENKLNNCFSELLFVTRCNSWGGFTAESERELDFLRMVYKKAGSDKYKLTLLGINEVNGQLIDRKGEPCKISDFQNAIGAILSTLLVMDPIKLLHHFANVKYPVSIWWEQPISTIPFRFFNKQNLTFFNATFGSIPGIEMGKYLLKKGFTQIAYISPYHNSSWSIDRLSGLKESGLYVIPYTDKEYASPWDFKQLARIKVQKHSVEGFARELLKRKLIKLFNQNKNFENLPIVCVNDEVASVIIEMITEKTLNIKKPIFGFDNSAESYLLRLPSYEFNTQALVDHMFYNIKNPSAFEGEKKLQQILGIVVEK